MDFNCGASISPKPENPLGFRINNSIISPDSALWQIYGQSIGLTFSQTRKNSMMTSAVAFLNVLFDQLMVPY